MENFMLTFFSAKKWKEEQNALGAFWRDFLHKSISPFQKWTKKMSKNENPKYFCAKTVDFHLFTFSLLGLMLPCWFFSRCML